LGAATAFTGVLMFALAGALPADWPAVWAGAWAFATAGFDVTVLATFVADDLLLAAFDTGFFACTALSGLRAVTGFDADFAGDFLI
jgi:hypothetical protein